MGQLLRDHGQFKVRNSLLDDWTAIHNIQNDTQDGRQVRDYSIPEVARGRGVEVCSELL